MIVPNVNSILEKYEVKLLPNNFLVDTLGGLVIVLFVGFVLGILEGSKTRFGRMCKDARGLLHGIDVRGEQMEQPNTFKRVMMIVGFSIVFAIWYLAMSSTAFGDVLGVGHNLGELFSRKIWGPEPMPEELEEVVVIPSANAQIL